jgi:NADH-quinone oxidoreductase subunit F
VLVCGGPGCLAAGAKDVLEGLRQAAKDASMSLQVDLGACNHDDPLLSLSGCQGLCQQGPLVQILPDDIQYVKVKASDAKAIVEGISSHVPAPSLLGEARGRADHPFYRGQALRALSTCGLVDPESLDHYLALDGFSALARALESMTPDGVVEAVDKSGLRGRGGAGFPTGRKWKSALSAAEASGRRPFVLCNGDEGDPGAFMDRAIMEGSPLQVIEGMILGAFALRASKGYIYVRAEYPLAVEHLERAIGMCRKAGLLGDHILGSSLSFDLAISRGGGAFVCGESTALMRSIEGKIGEPRAKYTRSVERGLHDAPTVLNNVETWALVPSIVLQGPDAFAAMGTKRSKGTKAFSLTGQVQRTGLIEVPMGTTLRHLIFEIGGGVPPGRTFKAVQTGGPSGGCLPETQLDLPVDFDALTEAGSMMGSGGMIVMDDTSCMVDVARYFVNFLLEESCGKCVPCRLGLPQLSFLLGKLAAGKGTLEDIDRIEATAATMECNALCGLGKSAPNPVLSTLRYFRHEYEAHVKGWCPAGVCRDLIRYEITSDCTGCLACIKPCPETAITGELEKLHVIDQQACTHCGICRSVCNFDAIRVVSGPGVDVGGER